MYAAKTATATVGNRLTLVGDFARFAADSTGNESESATRTFTSLAINRFFSGLNDTVSSRAKNHTWRTGARADR